MMANVNYFIVKKMMEMVVVQLVFLVMPWIEMIIIQSVLMMLIVKNAIIIKVDHI